MAHILVIPAETHPTDHSFLEEVHARSRVHHRTFLQRSSTGTRPTRSNWHEAVVETFPLRAPVAILANFSVYLFDPRYAWHLLRHARSRVIDAVYVRDLTFPLFLAIVLRAWTNWAVVYQKSFPHEMRWSDPELIGRYRVPWLFAFARRIEAGVLRFLLRRCDAVIPISERMATELVELGGCARERVHAFGMGVDRAARDVAPPPARARGDALRMVYVGTLVPSRRLTILLDAIRLARDEHRVDVRLTVLGGTDAEVALMREEVARRALTSHVEVPGRVPRSAVYALMAQHHAAAIYIARDPRFRVASTTKLLESLAVGLPCICTDAVDMHRTVAETYGSVLVTDDSAGGYAAAIAELEQRWEELSRTAVEGRARVYRDFAYERARERMDQLIRRLVEGRTPARSTPRP